MDTAQLEQSQRRVQQGFQQLSTVSTAAGRNVATMNQQFNAGVAPINAQGNALTNLNKSLAANTSQTKLTLTGLKDHILGMGQAAAGAVGLFTSFNDLTGAQIRNERAQNAAASATNKVQDIQRALNKLVADGKKGTADYNAKLADLKIAQDKAQTATEKAAFSQDKLGDTYANFAANIVPSAIFAVTGFTDVLQGMGVKMSSVTGFFGKFKDAGGKLTGIFNNVGGSASGLTKNLIGIGATAAGIGLVTVGAIELADAMNKVAARVSNIKQPVSLLEAKLDTSGKSMNTFDQSFTETEADIKAGVPPIVLAFDAMFGTHIREKMLANAKQLNEFGKILVSDLGPAFKASSQDYITWSTNLIKGGKSLNEVFGFLDDSGMTWAQTAKVMASTIADLDNTTKPLIFTLDDLDKAFGKGFDLVKQHTQETTDLVAEDKKLQAVFPGITKAQLLDNDSRQAWLGIADKQTNILKTQHDDLIDQAVALGATGNQLKDYANTTNKSNKDLEVMNETLKHLNIQLAFNTKFITDAGEQHQIYLDGVLKGITAGRDWAKQMMVDVQAEISQRTELQNVSIAMGFYTNLLGFSTGKMQDIIKAQRMMTDGHLEEQTAIAMDTSFLHDNVLIMTLRRNAMLDGIKSANDWVVATISQVAQDKAFHDQQVAIASSLGITADLTNKTTSEIQAMTKAALGDADAIKAMNEAFTSAAAGGFKDLIDRAEKFGHGFKKLDINKDFKRVNDDVDKFASKFIKKLSDAGDEGAKKFTLQFAKDPKKFGVKGKDLFAFDDLRNWINEHAGEPADQFVKEFAAKWKDLSPETKTAFGQLMAGLPDVAANVGTNVGDSFASGFTTAIEKNLKITKIGRKLGFEKGGIKAGVGGGAGAGGNISASFDLSKTKAQVMPVIDQRAYQKSLQLAIDNAVQTVQFIDNALKKVSSIPVPAPNEKTYQKGLQLAIDNSAQTVDLIGKELKKVSKIKVPGPDLSNFDSALDKMVQHAKSAVSKVEAALKKGSSSGVHVGASVGAHAQHGMHTTLTQDTVIQAHANERVDITPLSQMKRSSSGGGFAGGDINIELTNVLFDERMMRKFKARQGTNRYTFG